jgi:g-D-glutamyl-meso-diaminopimelate peptidase
MEYIVRPGDTFFLIAQRFNVSLNELMRMNPMVDPNRLMPGQVLRIPTTGSVNGGTYIVRKGDTLSKIANRHQVTVNAILQLNPELESGEYIYPGQVLRIPQQAARSYVIQRGDTLYRIAQKFGLTVNEILRVNPGVDPNRLMVGQTINLPRPVGGNIVQTNQEYGYNDLTTDLQQLRQRYPFIHVESIGESVMGKDLWAVRLGRGPKEVFYSASWHANEWITTPVMMKFIEDYAEAYRTGNPLRGYDVNYLFNNASIWIVPMVNPDGVELVQEGITPDHPFYEEVLRINNGSRVFDQWSANIRGVDLNHQWPAGWEIENARSPQQPAPRKYGGPRPLSEPETQVVHEFTLAHDFQAVLAYHSQGRVIFWGYENLAPPESERIVNRYAQLSGYTPVKLAESFAGYKDWFVQEYRRPGFTVEVGLGTNPLPISQFPTIYNENQAILLETPLLV